jgi:hypothetical protein
VITRKSNTKLKRIIVAEKKRKREKKASEKRAAIQARHDQLTLLINGPMPYNSDEEDLMPLKNILA